MLRHVRVIVIGSVGALLMTGCGSRHSETAAPVPAAAADSGAVASQPMTIAEKEAAAPRDPLKNAYFGELHLHTSYSLDAYIFGNTMNDPFVAYRFARGGEVTLANGARKRIKVPLDFAAITDHAEALGEYEICTNAQIEGYQSETCKGIRANDMAPFIAIFEGSSKTPAVRLKDICGDDGSKCRNEAPVPWQRIQQAAAENYEPGKFTSLIAYEYSAGAPEGQGGMMHRNVIFRGAVVPDTVFSAFEGTGEDLHKWLEEQCTGDCRVLTIPHNPNFYWGRLYWGKNSDGTPFTKEIVERRARMDRLVEIMQIKGNSECQTGIGTTDEECNFETVFRECTGDKTAGCDNEYGFVRNGLKLGLREEEKWGTNPFKQGFVGATDNHNGTPGDTAEDDYEGHYANNDGTPEVRLGLKPNPTAEAMGMSGDDDPTKLYNPGAITGVWAESNTREGIWDALYRKETFATSGTRVKLRLFGGFDLPGDLNTKPDWVKVAYDRGVPQGGDLSKAPDGKAPTFVVWAARDPMSAPLAKIQIVKVWRTSDDKLEEMTYDVACSDGMTPDAKSHRCPDNGATVNLEDCSISKDKGAAEMSTVWSDPAFDSKVRAAYYARVLENPVCRWSMYDAKKAGVPYPEELEKTIKERAWSSPIWYTP